MHRRKPYLWKKAFGATILAVLSSILINSSLLQNCFRSGTQSRTGRGHCCYGPELVWNRKNGDIQRSCRRLCLISASARFHFSAVTLGMDLHFKRISKGIAGAVLLISTALPD